MISRTNAVKALEGFGITGEQVYLIDLIPLIEIMWADGQIQKGEVAVLEDYIEKHVNQVNRQAGCHILSFQMARDFVDRFIDERPSSELMKTLRDFIKPVRMANAAREENEQSTACITTFCEGYD